MLNPKNSAPKGLFSLQAELDKPQFPSSMDPEALGDWYSNPVTDTAGFEIEAGIDLGTGIDSDLGTDSEEVLDPEADAKAMADALTERAKKKQQTAQAFQTKDEESYE